uniref:Putative N-acetyltransferase n=1 Tax=Magnetococcus massalia (strain MO-1) TaxID=451514 RepID=A0A1S7LIX7_MAGMO|nr:putative N-acetyltransferase [Candidatus Magnetococcus massalia]
MARLCEGLQLSWGERKDTHEMASLYQEVLGKTLSSEQVRLLVTPPSSGLSRIVRHRGQIVGHHLMLPLMSGGGPQSPRLMGIASLLVHPDWRSLGIGGLLVEDGIRACSARGYNALFTATLPDYFLRFGFAPYYGAAYGKPPIAWVRPLSSMGLLGWEGHVIFHPLSPFPQLMEPKPLQTADGHPRRLARQS